MESTQAMKGGLTLRQCRWCQVIGCGAERVPIPGSPNAICPNGHRSAPKLTQKEKKVADMEGLPEATNIRPKKRRALFEIDFLPGRYALCNGQFSPTRSVELTNGHVIAILRTPKMVRIREFKPVEIT